MKVLFLVGIICAALYMNIRTIILHSRLKKELEPCVGMRARCIGTELKETKNEKRYIITWNVADDKKGFTHQQRFHYNPRIKLDDELEVLVSTRSKLKVYTRREVRREQLIQLGWFFSINTILVVEILYFVTSTAGGK